MKTVPKLLALAALVAAVPAPHRAATPNRIAVRFGGPNNRNLVIAVAEQRGFFAKHGIDFSQRPFSGGPEAITAAAAGEIDVGSVGSPVLVGAARGVPIRIVGSPAEKGNSFLLVGGRGVSRVEDLAGKKIGVSSVGGGNRQALKFILAAKGVSIDRVQLVGVGSGNGNAYAALQSGRVDAVISSDPWASKIEVDGVGKVLAAAADYFGRYQHSYVFATKRFLDEHPDAVREFLAAYREAIVWAKAHQDEVVAIGVKVLELDEKVVRRYVARAVPRWDEDIRVDLVGANNAVRILKEVGDLDASLEVKVEEYIDRRFGAI